MKYRNGFVSNSSSSSFIIHESSLTQKQVEELNQYLFNLEKFYDAKGERYGWRGHGFYYLYVHQDGFFEIHYRFLAKEELDNIIHIIGEEVYRCKTYKPRGGYET